MRTFLRQQLWPAIAILIALTVVTGIVYPAAVTVIAQVAFKPAPASVLLQRNLLIYGLGGIIAPFLGIKAIDLIVSGLHLA